MENILFYKYVEIADPEQFRQELLATCLELQLLGKILVATEGINGCVSGSEESTAVLQEYLRADPRFADMEFKVGSTSRHNFKKMFVRIRKEIVTTNFDVDLRNAAEYIEPEELKVLLESGEDVVLIDARNNYESRIGKFTHALAPDIALFSEWPAAVAEMEELKKKQIVTYCTGGIRCEKASAYLKEQGFTNVRQLHGGIIRYGQEVGNAHWEGKCFVFDQRGAIEIDPREATAPITQCELCHLPSDKYENCALVTCDRRFITCEDCLATLEGCCSKRCRNQRRSIVGEAASA